MKKKIVVLTGAGISAESGIKTFRGGNGLWDDYPIEQVASIDGWHRDPALVLSFYNKRRRELSTVVPNAAHLALAALQDQFDVKIITQNVDDLHERAGSKQIIHLHGELVKSRSVLSDTPTYPLPVDAPDLKLGDTDALGNQLRPFIVWFGEAVPMIEAAIEWVRQADILLIIGTSMQVYPAAGLVEYATRNTPIYLIDPVIPNVTSRQTIHPIEATASEGMKQFVALITK